MGFLSVSKNDFLFPVEHYIDSFYNEFFKSSNVKDAVKAVGGYPKMDVNIENDRHLVIRAAVPGMTVDDINIEFSNRILKISGQMKEEYKSSNNAVYYVQELRKSKFTRELELPEWVKEEPEATLKDGILKLTWEVPLKEEPEKPKLIKVKPI